MADVGRYVAGLITLVTLLLLNACCMLVNTLVYLEYDSVQLCQNQYTYLPRSLLFTKYLDQRSTGSPLLRRFLLGRISN